MRPLAFNLKGGALVGQQGAPDIQGAARAQFLKMTPRKWRLVRILEYIVRPVLSLLPSPRRAADAACSPKRILVVEYWNIGDLAIVTPFLRNLRRVFPVSQIVLLANAEQKSFLEGQRLVDEVIPVLVPWAQHLSRWKKYNLFSKNWISLLQAIRALRQQHFDLAFSGRMDIRDNLLLWLSGAARRIGYGFGGGGFLLTDCVTPDLSSSHRASVWEHLLDSFGAPAEPSFHGLSINETDRKAARDLLRDRGVPENSFLIGIHPGARISTRRWGDSRFAEVADHILRTSDVRILWFSDPNDPSMSPTIDRCHSVRANFRVFQATLAHCRLLICNDSGPMHLAGLLGVPVVAVFGPQVPEWFGPRGSCDRVVIRREFWCRPCFDYCIFDQPYCLRTITPSEVIKAASESLTEIRASMSIAGNGVPR